MEIEYESATIYFTVDICTVEDYVDISDLTDSMWDDLLEFIDSAVEDAEWPNGSSLDDRDLEEVIEGDNGEGCGVISFTFTGYAEALLR